MRVLRKAKVSFGFAFAFCILSTVAGATVYQEPADFVRQSFGQSGEDARRIWLKGEVREQVAAILGHPYPALRLAYWVQGTRSLWVLDEIGKERPITVGVVVGAEGVEQVRILAFRESRGGEVRFPSFLSQFKQAVLGSDHQLDRPIDGISGATLSVRAVSRLVRMALLLHGTLDFSGITDGPQ